MNPTRSSKGLTAPKFLGWEIQTILERRVKPWTWHLGGLLLFLATYHALSGSAGAQPPFRQLLAVITLVSASCAGFAFLQHASRFPQVLLFPTTLTVLSAFYLGLMAIAALAPLGPLGTFFCAGFGFQIVWLLAGARLRLIPQRPSLLVVPSGRCLDAIAALQPYAQCRIPPDADLLGRADGVLLDPDVDLHASWLRLLTGKGRPLDMYHVDVVMEALEQRTPLEYLRQQPERDLRVSPVYERVKRVLDVLIVLYSMPLTVPLCLAVALCIKLDSRGPVFFRQTRVGRNGSHFQIVKFRSMKPDSEAEGADFAKDRDARITRFGHFMRKVRLDEIPQFWNVLKGDMSLIGPRPEQVPFVEKFQSTIPFYWRRHSVRPGVTGWAQIHQGYVDSLEQTRRKLEYDLYYIKAYSLWMDLLIFARTIPTVLSGFGAR
jgi:lipopolysaccharide/colanic/teichoic acid biosynthesis glycosyltransferase